MQTVSVSCELAVASDKYCIFGWVQGAVDRKLITIVENLPRCTVEFGKICHGKLWSLFIVSVYLFCFT